MFKVLYLKLKRGILPVGNEPSPFQLWQRRGVLAPTFSLGSLGLLLVGEGKCLWNFPCVHCIQRTRWAHWLSVSLSQLHYSMYFRETTKNIYAYICRRKESPRVIISSPNLSKPDICFLLVPSDPSIWHCHPRICIISSSI